MADRPLSALAELNPITNTASFMHIVDIDEAAPVDQNKRVSVATLLAGAGGGSTYTNADISSGVDVDLETGVAANRNFITPTANINVTVDTPTATNETYFLIVNLDPASFTIDVKIDIAGNPTQITLDASTTWINAAYTGTNWRFWG